MSDILAGIVAAKHCAAGHKWHEIGALYNLNSTTTRGKYLHRDKAKFPKGVMPGDCPICDDGGLDYAGAVEVMGLTAAATKLTSFSEAALWDRAYQIQDRHAALEEKRKEQRITIPGKKAFAWAWVSDLHFGGDADYRQMRRDAEIIRDTPRMWAGFNGDGPNNWIIGKLQAMQRKHSMSLDDEWQLFLSYLRIIKEKLKVIALGNHDLWTLVLGGVDPVRAEMADCQILYDEYEVTYRLMLGADSWLVKQRHRWRGSSVFNPTHGIEVGWQRGSCEFDIGVGSHTHIGTTCRPFFRHGVKKYAVLLGAYSMSSYGRQLGLAPTCGTGCGAMIFEPGGGVTFFENLETAAKFLRFLNGD